MSDRGEVTLPMTNEKPNWALRNRLNKELARRLPEVTVMLSQTDREIIVSVRPTTAKPAVEEYGKEFLEADARRFA